MTQQLCRSFFRNPAKFLKKKQLLFNEVTPVQANYRRLFPQANLTSQDVGLPANVADATADRDDCLELLNLGGANPCLLWDIDEVTDYDFREIKLQATGQHCQSAIYLPWQRKRITYVTLDNNWGANVFFTATLSGCSIYITGPAHHPTVYHANAFGIGDNAQNRDQLKRQYMDGLYSIAAGDATLANLTHVLRPESYDTVDDMIARKEAQGRVFAGGAHKHCYRNDTFVAGVRKSGTWRFYYQRSAEMHYSRPKRTLPNLFRTNKRMKQLPIKMKVYSYPLPEA